MLSSIFRQGKSLLAKPLQNNRCNIALSKHSAGFFRFSSSALKLETPEHDEEKTDFASIKEIPQHFQKALSNVFKYETMSPVQQKVLNMLPSNLDILVKAKTGTGKTLAFLLAVSPLLKKVTAPTDSIPILVVAPTRELASQIWNETYKLFSYTGHKCHLAVGGASRAVQVNRIVRGPCSVLIATPGRLLDLLDNEPELVQKLSNTKALVLDEVDRLMDQGFYVEIQKIVSRLPKERQNLYFSATFDKKTSVIIQETMKPGYVFMDCIDPNEMDSHEKIDQTIVTLPHNMHLPWLYETLKNHNEQNQNSKILVFFPTAALTQYCASVFNKIEGLNVLEIHSKLDQRERDRVSYRFRAASSAVMFTTDLSARGVDYPNVSLVVQMGPAPSREDYIHRVGRTGRAGKEGQGIVLLAPFEKRFAYELTKLPVSQLTVNSKIDPESVKKVDFAVNSVALKSRAGVFLPWFMYSGQLLKRLSITKESWVTAGQKFAQGYLKLDDIPPLPANFVRQAGLGSFDKIKISKTVEPKFALGSSRFNQSK